MEMVEAIERIVRKMLKPKCVVGKVTAVDATAKTCTVEVEGGYTRYGVRLRADEEGGNTGLYIIPAQNSRVLIEMIEGQTGMWYVAMVSEVNPICLNGDQYKGLLKLDEVKANMDTLKTYCETLKASTASGLAAVGIGALANGTTGQTAFNTAMASASINFQDMENPKVKHG